MTYQEQELIKRLLAGWVSFCSKDIAVNEIAGSGDSLEGRLVDFKGEIPESSDFKFDTIGPRVDKAKKIKPTTEEIRAFNLVESVDENYKGHLVAQEWYKTIYLRPCYARKLCLRFQELDYTQVITGPFTLQQKHIAHLLFNQNVEAYKKQRTRAKHALLEKAKLKQIIKEIV